MTQGLITPTIEMSPRSSLHGLVGDQAQRTPESVALVAGELSMTYRELDDRSNQVANYLLSTGVGTGDVVAVCLHRSVNLVIALLGILKVGAAYLPIDPSNPARRIQHMLEHSEASTLVSEKSVHARVAFTGRYVDVPNCFEAKSTPVNSERPPDSLAYIIYTSGSTGTPKGVMITHANVVSMLSAVQKMLQLSAANRVAAITSMSFDIAVLEVFLPLAVGASIVLVSHESVRDGRLLQKELANSNSDIVQATPATWRLLLEAGWQSKRTTILCGGDKLTPELADHLIRAGREVWNLYGPTETTVWATLKRLRLGDPPAIGEPLENTETYILTEDYSEVVAGSSGELYIGGKGVARGYVREPALTAACFVPHPFRDGLRLYKTGDIVKRNANGDLEFIERLDQQIKIRGFRVELGEIENALARIEGVAQAAVVLSKRGADLDLIVAYYVGSAVPEAARAILREWLPQYMIPSRLVRLDEMPLTPNRKIDRKALSAIGVKRPGQENVEMHELILEIWKKVLCVESIGAHDNFFELGGHSLLAMKVASEIEKKCSRSIPVELLFEYQTISTLAKHLLSEKSESSKPEGAERSRGHARRQSYLGSREL